MIFASFRLALAQASDPKFLRVLLLGLALTVALFVAVFAAAFGFLQWLFPEDITIWGWTVTSLKDFLSVGALILMLVLSVFLMVPVASAFTGLFLDDIAAAVEAKHYPRLPPVTRLPMTEVLQDTLNFLVVLLMANTVALVVYLLFIPLAPLIFWALNGYLLGREYYQLVAMRRLGRAGAKESRRAHSGTIWLAGVLMAAPLSIPLLNLVVPILGVATFTHIFHRLEPGAR